MSHGLTEDWYSKSITLDPRAQLLLVEHMTRAAHKWRKETIDQPPPPPPPPPARSVKRRFFALARENAPVLTSRNGTDRFSVMHGETRAAGNPRWKCYLSQFARRGERLAIRFSLPFVPPDRSKWLPEGWRWYVFTFHDSRGPLLGGESASRNIGRYDVFI